MKKITIKILGLTEVIEYTRESKRTYSAVKEMVFKRNLPYNGIATVERDGETHDYRYTLGGSFLQII